MPNCNACGFTLPKSARFCAQCAAPVGAEAQPPPVVTYCRNCNAALPPAARFCVQCQMPITAAAPPQPVAGAPAAVTGVGDFFSFINRDPTGLTGAVIVFFVAAVLAWVSWWPLSLPSRLIGYFVPEGDCMAYVPGSLPMYFCSMKVALLTMVGPIILIVAIIAARAAVTRLSQQLAAKLPADTRFLIPPLVATIFFTIAWSGVHFYTSGDTGLLPQKFFPAVVGLFTYASIRYRELIQNYLHGFFVVRDQFPKILRVIAAALIPLFLSLIITFQERVSQTALKEQIVVIVAMITGYLALTPFTGRKPAAEKEAAQRLV